MNMRDHLLEAKRLVLDGLKEYNVRVYLFGSRAKGGAGITSDIDIAVMPLEALPPGVLSTIRENLGDSCIIYEVDLVDLSQTDLDFRERVMREGLLWRE